jgi:hypothetical protein
MPDDETPPVRRLTLKPKEIVRTDTVARPGDGTEISVRLMHLQNQVAEQKSSLGKWDGLPDAPAEVTLGPGGTPVLLPRDVAQTDPRSCAGDGTAITVDLIHRQNRLAQEKLGPEIVAMPPRRRSRRTHDFIMLVGSASLMAVIFVLAVSRTMSALIMAFIGVAFVAVSLAWIMFGVMDDY